MTEEEERAASRELELEAARRRIEQLEQDLAEHARSLRELDQFFSLSHDLLSIIDYGGHFLKVNPAWERALGFSVEELLARLPVSLIHPDDLEAAYALASIAERGGEIVSFHARYLRKDGSYAWLEWSVVCLPEERRFYSVTRDITERKRVEAEHASLQARVERVLQQSHVVVYSCDPRADFATTFVSENITWLLGHEPAELLRDPRFWSGLVHPEDRQRLMQEGASFFEVGQTSSEYRVRHKDGTYRWIHDEAKVVRDDTGAPVEVLGSWHDITERKRADLLIQSQANALMELSTPLIPIGPRVLAMPLVGAVDTRRAQQVLETLLEGIARSGAQVAILDVTGVPLIDTQVASALVRAARAVRLLGAEVVLTGIRPEVAQTLVTIGADLGDIATRSTLQAGIAYAMRPV